jgi:protease-4
MKVILKSIYNILKYIGKFFIFIRNFFLNLLLLAVLGAIIFAVMPIKIAQIPPGTVLRLDISGDIVEEKKIISSLEKVLNNPFSLSVPEPETDLQDILDTINAGAIDDRITTILLNVKDMGKGGLNQLQNIGQALERFKEQGKTVVAAEDFYTQSQYFLASHASTIMLNPMGGVDIHGFGVYRLYFKDALEKLEINYNIFKVGTYKSALEPFTRNSMSTTDQLQNELWLSEFWKLYTSEISRQRNISLDALHYYTDNIAEALSFTQGDPAQLALQTGLVDQIATREETASYLASLAPQASGTPNILSSNDYLQSIVSSYQEDTDQKTKIGLIIAEGTILPGKQPPGFIGGDSLSELIKKARQNEDIKALVLRINSGGGSAFASEIIRQELLALKESGKPLVVSMGTVAASGGYWIAADADEIWASPATLTGSIGIFGAIPTFEKTLASLGIYRDGTGTTPLAAALDLTQPLPEQLKDAIQQTIVYNYNQFLQIVADGRNLEKSRVAELAEGRIYDGQTAKTIGLVDQLGSLEDAIKAAASLADLTLFSTEKIQRPVSAKEHFLQFLSTGFGHVGEMSMSQNRILSNLKNSLLSHFETSLILDDPRHTYAQCLVNLAW